MPDPRAPGLPFITVSVVLNALVVLLLAFVLTQARVLFGGAEFLRTTANLSVANYAREGFFQLIAASGVVLATLVMAEWLLAADDAHARRQYRTVSVALLALVALLLVSSATRIVLYMNEFGLSIDRAFAECGDRVGVRCVGGFRPHHAARPVPCSSCARRSCVTVGWVSLVNLINPEALVVRVNVARATAGASFDAAYHAHLSADALPLLLQECATPAACRVRRAAGRTAGVVGQASRRSGGRPRRLAQQQPAAVRCATLVRRRAFQADIMCDVGGPASSRCTGSKSRGSSSADHARITAPRAPVDRRVPAPPRRPAPAAPGRRSRSPAPCSSSEWRRR
ncbi:MAG: DUF4153 domain-containing protein [Gemmatimonadaceae bacterium]|nr:DUF4153 domain-containing protein [Gemmatimonadaceae bacterium]